MNCKNNIIRIDLPGSGFPVSCRKNQRHGIKVIFLFALALVFSFSVCTASAGTSSSVWLERQKSSFRDRMKKKQQSHGEKKEASEKQGHPSGHPGQKEPEQHKPDQNQSDKKEPEKKKRRRSPMSRPAAYLLKSGNFPDLVVDSPELLQTVCWLKSPDQSYKKIVPKKTQEGILLYDEAFQEGLYKIYLYRDAGIENGIHYRHFSAHWFRNAGEDEFETIPFTEEKREGLYGEEPVFYLKELAKDNENNFVSQKRYTGDTFPVQVLFKGVPVPGVPVTITTAKGWEKTVVTDEQGKASFLLIKEIFHNGKIHKEPELYLVKAVYTMNDPVAAETTETTNGSTNGATNETALEQYSKEIYTATIALTVYPTPYDWKSKSAGFFIFTGSILIIMFAAAIRRKRSLAL